MAVRVSNGLFSLLHLHLHRSSLNACRFDSTWCKVQLDSPVYLHEKLHCLFIVLSATFPPEWMLTFPEDSVLDSSCSLVYANTYHLCVSVTDVLWWECPAQLLTASFIGTNLRLTRTAALAITLYSLSLSGSVSQKHEMRVIYARRVLFTIINTASCIESYFNSGERSGGEVIFRKLPFRCLLMMSQRGIKLYPFAWVDEMFQHVIC